jgi:hypothetical protein
MPEPHIDASLFMGMHAEDETVRVACKNFFVEQLSGGGRIVMSLEQVGRCDAIVWRRDRAEQDDYYPFMDVLHTELAIDRIPYQEPDIKTALSTPELADLDLTDRLTVGMALARGSELVTVSPRLHDRADLPVRPPGAGAERAFPPYLEERYQRSLVLRVSTEEV